MSTEQELIKTIEKLVEEKTFSLEGAKAIAELKRSVEAKDANTKNILEQNSRHVKANENLIKQNEELNEIIKKYQNEEKAIKDKEKSLSNSELRIAVAEAKHGTLYDIFNTLFKNTIVRENIQKRAATVIPSAYAGGMATTQSVDGGSETKTSETE